MTATTETSVHLHDMEIVVGVGDVPEALLDDYAQDMVAAIQTAVETFVAKSPYGRTPGRRQALSALNPQVSVTYDGRRYCDRTHSA